jgi:ribosomal protein S18 acetylase RimI-like enzyme
VTVNAEVVLRKGVKSDALLFFELDKICFTADIAYSLREFRHLLRSKKAITVAAEITQQLAGFIIAQPVSAHGSRGGQIITIDVAPAYQRRGVGRLLMREVEAQLRANEAEWLQLEVAKNNSAALAFYLGLGFVPIGEIEGYYSDGNDAVIMQKSLQNAGSSARVTVTARDS